MAWARVGDYQCSAVYDLLGAGVVVAGWWVIGVRNDKCKRDDTAKGDALTVLAGLPDASVHCVVTSPPYYGLRDYGVDSQIPGRYAGGVKWIGWSPCCPISAAGAAGGWRVLAKC